MISRRKMIVSGAAVVAGGGLLLARSADAASTQPANPTTDRDADYTPVITPNGTTLPWKIVDGVKVGHLIAEPCRREFAPGIIVDCWGYNGQTPGPTIEAVEGDRVRIYVTNRLPEPTTVHWHGLHVPNGMDGVAGLTQKPIAPGETFKYEFALNQSGTYMYHPHTDDMTQQGMGLMGMLVIHPRDAGGIRVDRDFAIMLSEWRVDPGTRRPITTEMMEFNLLTMNSKVFPATDPLVVRKGDRVRIRFGNLGAMDHHPIHLHGFDFLTTEMDGARVADSARQPGNTVLVAVGATRAIEFVADAPGDWAMHCHMTHHTMNQMGHNVPNMLGADMKGFGKVAGAALGGYMAMGQHGMASMTDMKMPVPPNSIPMQGGEGNFGTIDMGGMFTILKIRDELPDPANPGVYQHPPGTLADVASKEEMHRDGIDG